MYPCALDNKPGRVVTLKNTLNLPRILCILVVHEAGKSWTAAADLQCLFGVSLIVLSHLFVQSAPAALCVFAAYTYVCYIFDMYESFGLDDNTLWQGEFQKALLYSTDNKINNVTSEEKATTARTWQLHSIAVISAHDEKINSWVINTLLVGKLEEHSCGSWKWSWHCWEHDIDTSLPPSDTSDKPSPSPIIITVNRCDVSLLASSHCRLQTRQAAAADVQLTALVDRAAFRGTVCDRADGTESCQTLQARNFQDHFSFGKCSPHRVSPAAADSDAAPLTRFQTDEPDFGRQKINQRRYSAFKYCV